MKFHQGPSLFELACRSGLIEPVWSHRVKLYMLHMLFQHGLLLLNPVQRVLVLGWQLLVVPGVLHDAPHSDPLLGVDLEDLVQEVPDLRGQRLHVVCNEA